MENYIISMNPIVQFNNNRQQQLAPACVDVMLVVSLEWVDNNMEMIIIYNGWIAITGCFRDHQLIYINL